MDLSAPQRLFAKAETDSPGSGVLVLNKKRYAAGLIWLVAEPDALSDLSRQRIKALGADFSCLREGNTTQQGFGFLRLGHRMGMASAAAAAAETLIGEWQGVFAAENGWWYVAVHGDAIAPDGDILFESEEEAYNTFVQRSETHKWPRSYAPASWNLSNTDGEISLDKILEGETPVFAYLKPANLTAFFGGARRKKIFLASGAFFVLLILGLMALVAMIGNSATSQKGPESFPVALDAPDLIRPPPPLPEKDRALRATFATLNAPLPSGILAACLRDLDVLLRPVPGWEATEAGCNIEQTAVQWKSKSGSLSGIESVRNSFPDDARLAYGTSGALLIALPHTKLDILTQNFMLLPKADAILLIERTLSAFGQLQIRYLAPKTPTKTVQRPGAPKPVVPKNKPPEKPPTLTVTLSGMAPPSRVQSAFDLPGLTLQNVKWDIKTRTWAYQAEMLVESETPNDAAAGR